MAALIGKITDPLWNALDTMLATLIPKRIRDILCLAQPAFNFTASKFVVIKDWRLGVILRVLQFAILIYILVNVFKSASYLETEVPKGIVSPYVKTVTGAKKVEALEDQIANYTNLPYCSNPDDYNFVYSGNAFNNFQCKYSQSSSLAEKGESQFFITTHTTMDQTAYYKAASEATCPPEPEGYRSLLYLSGACVYERRVSMFPMSAESGTLSLLHGYSTSVIKKFGVLPKSYVRGLSTGIEEIFEEGTEIKLEVGRWLQLAGVDLDAAMDDPKQHGFTESQELTGEGAYAGSYPKVRVSGVDILVTMNYYQRNLAPAEHKKISGKRMSDIICLVSVVPSYRWSLQGSDVRHMLDKPEAPIYIGTEGLSDDLQDGELVAMQVDLQNYGIMFKFQPAGNLGRFSFAALIAALVAGSVMLSVAQIVVTFVALYVMGLSSQLYMEFMRESVDWRKEYARFAAQALVAGYAFMGYDENNSFRLDRKEVFKTLKLILGQRLPEDKLAALADFVMRQGEHDTTVSKGAFRLDQGDLPATNLISIEEWIDIFTEEKVSLPALERLIDNEYKDVRTRDFLVRAAHGVRTRGLPGEEEPEDEAEDDDIDPEMLAYQQSAKRQMTQAFLANMQPQTQPKGPPGGPDIES